MGQRIAEVLSCRHQTVENVRRGFVLDGEQAAQIMVLRLSPPPARQDLKSQRFHVPHATLSGSYIC